MFGPNGAGSRVFALADTAFTMGLMLGPFISGSLVAFVGYSNMNLILGNNLLGFPLLRSTFGCPIKTVLIDGRIGMMCVACSAASFCFLGRRNNV